MPKDSSFLDTLAFVYLKKQMYAEAEQAITKAIKLAPEEESYVKRLNKIRVAREQKESSGRNEEMGK